MTEEELELLEKQLYFSKEAAEYLGITVQRLNKLIQEEKIKPLKKNASGTVFHIDELNRRKEELEIFTKIEQGDKCSMFRIDTKTKQEALNFATLMNVLDYTESRLEPSFVEFGKIARLDIPLTDERICSKCAEFFGVSIGAIQRQYKLAYDAFSTLRPTDEIIKRGDISYPPLLAQTEQAPRFLYLRGKKALLHEKRTVALVGSRMASETSKQNTEKLSKELGKNGITVVSGLAKGIDVSAHSAALQYGFNTIAVIGTNLNQYYPAENKAVQQAIERMGLIVSQFSPATKTQRWFFPLRNGVMSGLSLATVIMEAGETSGALKQADFALKQGRQVLIPQKALEMRNITWPARYVERGAQVVDSPRDVIRTLAESNIFKVRERYIGGEQETLESYLANIQEPSSSENDICYAQSIIIEE